MPVVQNKRCSSFEPLPSITLYQHPKIRLILPLIPLAFLLCFFLYPLGAIFRLSFAQSFHLTLSQITHYFEVMWFTLWQATLSTGLTLLVGLPSAYVFARYRFPGKTLLRALATIPFVLPTVVIATAFSVLFGSKGILNQGLMAFFHSEIPPLNLQYSLSIILLAHVFYNYTIVLRLVGGFWATMDPRLTEAARMLGASHWQAFWRITMPLLLPVIAAAALLIFLFCFTSFGVILILGGPRFSTIEVEIYYQAVYLFNLPLAATLALVQMLFMAAVMTFFTRLQNRPMELKTIALTQTAPQHWYEHLLVWATIVTMVILLATPLFALILRSLTVAGSFSLAYYHHLLTEARADIFFVPPREAITNSLMFAVATVVVATMLGLMVALILIAEPSTQASSRKWRRWFDTLFMLPLATSAVTLGFGYIITMGKPPFSWFHLRTSPALVVIAHTLVALPFVVRAILPALRQIQPSLRESAAMLGASPWRVWREVDWPIIRRAMLVGAVFAFTVSMGEFGATLFIARPDTPTMPTAIYRLLGQPGTLNYGQALAMSTLLMTVCAIGFILIERFRAGTGDEF